MSRSLLIPEFSQVSTMNNLKLVCLFNGKLMQCIQSGELRYFDGKERVVCVDRNILLSGLVSKVIELHHCSYRGKNNLSSFVLFYGVERTEDCLFKPLTSDNDVKCMVDKYYRVLETLGVKPSVWICVCYNEDIVKYSKRSDAVNGHLVGRYHPMRLGYGADVNGGIRCLEFTLNEPDIVREYLDNCRNYGGTLTNPKLNRSMVGHVGVRTGLDVSKRGLTVRPKNIKSWMVPSSSSGIEKDMQPVTSSDHGLNSKNCVGVAPCASLDAINCTSSEGQMSQKNGLGSECPDETSVDLLMHGPTVSSFVVAADDSSEHNATEKDNIKTNRHVKINGGLPADLATFNTYLATKDLQTINSSDIECINELGTGAYSTVFYGKCQGTDVAIRKLRLTRLDMIDETLLVADFWKEAHILSHLHHPNVVALYGVVRDGHVSNYATVTEYMVNGSLKQVLMRKYRTIDDRKKIIIAMDAACGMEYLHANNLTHFNLKSHNLLVNMRDPLRPVCKIGDLGLSRVKQQILVCDGVQEALPWIAPELLNRKEKVNEKVDVYSFGIVMWELLTGKEPYSAIRPVTIIGGILEGKLRPEIPCWCNPQWRALMEKCWTSVPDARPSFSQIVTELRAMAASMNIKFV